jgi:hypothetical protein
MNELGHTAVVVKRKMYVIGGKDGLKEYNDLHVLDLVTKTWSSPKLQGFPLPPISDHSCTAIGDNLLIFGKCVATLVELLM